ncbi:MAG: DUF4364 family protein [Oscillospiraceae bacterium]|nr:DUF4364 family protein [Oscillospiraceae bacterium]
MNPEQLPEEQKHDLPEEKLNGQLAFFPEMEPERPETEPAGPRAIPAPSTEQMSHWHICILLSDILLRFDGLLPEDWLYEIAVPTGHVSYFMYMDALGALQEQNAVTCCTEDGVPCLRLTDEGRRSVKQSRLYVPKYFRDRVHLTALRYVARQRALRDLHSSYERDGNGWSVTLTCTDRGAEMMTLRIHAPSEDQAEQFIERIQRNPARFFGKLLDLALTNEEEQYDLTDN